ncbi:MAG TPA: TerC family protein [Candidatus Eisenbacteria bacterium]
MSWSEAWPWVAFLAFVISLLVLDLGLLHRKEHVIRPREALLWSAFWVSLAMAFCVLIYFWKGPAPAVEFLTGYLIEESLSVDNLFVFVLIFTYFRVPPEYQHRVLFWGILGALVLRATFILAGAWLLSRFAWVEYIFGAFLLVTALRMLKGGEPEVHPEGNGVVRLFRRFFPVTTDYHGTKFFIRENGVLAATPLVIVLILVETTDVVFALDSIPAIFGVTRDPFIVFTSNIFAILGLRALYFLLASVLGLFAYLNIGLACVLAFIGLKMMLGHWVHISTLASLLVVFGLLALSIVASLLFGRKKAHHGTP